MSRTESQSDGENRSRTDIPKIKVYEGVDVSYSTADAVFDGFTFAYDTMWDYDKIPGYEVIHYDSDFDRSDYPDLNAVQAVEEWLDENNYDSKGFHLGLHSGSSENPGASAPAGKHGWNYKTWGQTNCNPDSDANITNTALHESFHKFIDSDLSSVQELTGDGDRDGEHTLGKVYFRSLDDSWVETPLGSPGASPYGTCDGEDTKPDVYSRNQTKCTGDSIEYTYNDRFG